MTEKYDNIKIMNMIDSLMPKIKKELAQTSSTHKEDLEQELKLFMVKFMKEYTHEPIDLFELFDKDKDNKK